MKNNIKKEAIVFFVLTLALSFLVFWGPIALFKIPTVNLVDGPVGSIFAIVLFIIGGFVPSIAGIALTGYYEGKTGVRNLLKNSVRFGFSLKWYFIMLASALFLAFGSILIYTTLGRNFDFSQFAVQLPTLLPLIILGPLSEEFGWRGFALKRMLKLTNPNVASLIIGLVWSLWHLPLFFMIGTSQNEFGLPFIVFLISVTSTSFAYTYFYIKTKGSLLSAIFLHWVFTFVMQVVASTVERTETYNWLEFMPALILGFIFSILLNGYKNKKNANF
ncbi:MAG: CPBP family intramembrane glutamic endopeptidase [Perlabentimonas sp.]